MLRRFLTAMLRWGGVQGRALLGCGLLSLCLLSGLTAAADGAGHAGHGVPGQQALGSSAAFDVEGTLWVAYRDGMHVMVRRSMDLGSNWSDPARVNAVPEPIAAEGEARPKIAVGSKGEIYVSWTRPLAKPYTGEIRFARSVDGGHTFSEPFTVHTDREEITHRFDALAVGAGGRVYLAWIDKRDLESARRDGQPYEGAALYLAISDDGGAHFRGDYKVADHSCECCRIALVPQADGGLLAFWRQLFAGGVRDHALARVDGEGATVSMRRATFDEWKIDACPHHGPSLAQGTDGTLHAVWFTQGPGVEGVHYGQLVKGAVRAQRRVGGDTAAHADIATDGARIAVVWTEFDGQRARLMSMTSTDGGRQWTEVEVAVSEGPYDQPRLLQHGGRFHVFWNRRDAPLFLRSLP